jgi:hypothetical protein
MNEAAAFAVAEAMLIGARGSFSIKSKGHGV